MNRSPKTFRVVTFTSISSSKLTRKVERALGELEVSGWTIVSVSFGMNALMVPKAFITVSWTAGSDATDEPSHYLSAK